MQYYLECLQIGTLTLIALFIVTLLSALLIANIIDNFKRVLIGLGIFVGVVAVGGLTGVLGMLIKAIFKI
jgi:hypothetical protein